MEFGKFKFTATFLNCSGNVEWERGSRLTMTSSSEKKKKRGESQKGD